MEETKTNALVAPPLRETPFPDTLRRQLPQPNPAPMFPATQFGRIRRITNSKNPSREALSGIPCSLHGIRWQT